MLPSLDLAAPRRFRVVLGPQDDYFTNDGNARCWRASTP